jgi:uridylate kinase
MPRVILKLSGEVLAGSGKGGLDPTVLNHTAKELASALKSGAKAAVVLGGGNIFRGLDNAAKGMDRVTADQMGMLATVINGLALVDAVKRAGGKSELFTSFPIGPIGTLYISSRVREAIDNGVLAILAGGTGNPFFSTDTAAALRAAELGCPLLLKGTKVDGVYDKDPQKHPDAKRFEQMTIDDMLDERLGVIDLTAATLCRENNIDIRVYNMTEENSIHRAALGKPIGTLVTCRLDTI